MEIVTAPYRPARPAWRRWLLLVAVLVPLTLLALLPVGLGLERYVITGDSMAPAIDRGSVVLERDVPVSDLRVGDVVTFHGFQPDEIRDELLRRAWLTMSTSHHEGWGLSIIEAAAYGVPTLVTPRSSPLSCSSRAGGAAPAEGDGDTGGGATDVDETGDGTTGAAVEGTAAVRLASPTVR